MLSITEAKEVVIHPGPTDMRYGMRGLSVLDGNPEEGSVHAFCSADRRTAKILIADEGCYYLVTKRLTMGRFPWPSCGEACPSELPTLISLLEMATRIGRIESNGSIAHRMV